MVFTTSSLSARLNEYVARDEEALADALAVTSRSALTARLAAAQIIAVERVLARENWRHLASGETADAWYEAAKASADDAFALLVSGLGRAISGTQRASRAITDR
jgi:hypothetical protein